MLYNDDVNVPAIQHAFRARPEEAEQYIASDCGEFGLDHRSIGFPDGNLILARALVAALHNGTDPGSGKPMGLQTGPCEQFLTFEALWNAYARQVDFFVGVTLDRLVTLYKVVEEDIAALLLAMLTDDCLVRGQGLFRGVRHKGLLIEIYGTINVADSLAAIQEKVYERRVFDLPQLVRMVDADFVGYEGARQILLNAPKYGNDDPVADGMALRVYRHICSTVETHEERLKLDFCLADLVNAGGHISVGKGIGALPDGRKAGMPLANANGPTNGRDSRRPTALLSSLARLRPSGIGGQVQHLKVNRELFTRSRPKLEALLKTYFAKGGSQVTVVVVGKDELEKAMKEPENHRDLIVRIGGYCERFVSLSRDIQEEIVARTLQS
jgi:pyruvate-formate lyase